MREYITNALGYVLTGITIPLNILEWISKNITINVLFLVIISTLTALYWIIRIVNKARKDKLEIKILKKQLDKN